MPYKTKIHFSGLMVFDTTSTPVKVIIPKVPESSTPKVGKHVSYIAFRKDKAQATGWTPEPFPPSPVEFLYVRLDGETIELSMGGDALRFGDFLPHLKTKYCPNLDILKAAYKTGTEAARVILTGGDDVGWHVVPYRKRIETIVEMHSDFSLELKATKQDSAAKYLKFGGEASIVIGNSDEADLDPRTAPSGANAAASTVEHTEDFLFYYLMFERNTGCNAAPSPSDANGNPNDKDEVVEIPPRGTGNLDIACSNSQYP